LQSGFLIAPTAIPAAPALVPGTPAPVPPGVTQPGDTPGEQPPAPTPPGGTPVSPGPAKQHLVELAFSADRNQLFTAWHALANLADLAGKVDVTVRATSAAGFDKAKLQNGVLEPLKETKLIE